MTTKETFLPPLFWITDRPPSETDAAPDGTVVVPAPGSTQEWDRVSWMAVEAGAPWLSFVPPEQPEPRVRRVPRKALQLAVCQDCLMAVADDGSIWIWSDSRSRWKDFSPLPGREEVE